MKNNSINFLAGILILAVILAAAWTYPTGFKTSQQKVDTSEEVVLPVVWGDLGQKLIAAGVIDAEKFKTFYDGQYDGNLPAGKLKMTKENSGYLLNLFWALGLASKNPILDAGEMKGPRYGGAQNFASTAGWILSSGSPMDHYSHHRFFDLTPEQQEKVEKVSSGIYRPCCGNPTHFPDCNHGMAMLGLLELMASQGVSEQEMWKVALAVNSLWFPDAYQTIAAYMKNQGVDWKDVNPQEVLGFDYSSAQGYARIVSQVVEPTQGRGSGCGI